SSPRRWRTSESTRRQVTSTSASAATATRSSSGLRTTAAAAPTRPARACAGWRAASRRSTARFRSPARAVARRSWRPCAPPGGAPLRVVIAEDLALLRDGLTRLLRDNGFDVVAAVQDGDALVHAVLAERPDIAIVDIRLPPTFRDEGLRAALEVRRLVPETAV